MSLEQRIAEGIAAMALEVAPDAAGRMARHLELVEKWNRVHNLTAVREPDQMVTLHVLDSLALLPWLGPAASLVDVGAGAGFPGIPLALARAELEVTLVDSSHKKCAFLEQARAELAAANLTVACERVETWHPGRRFDIVASRAFADLADFIAQSQHLLAPGGRMLAMKGVYPYEEIARVPATHRVAQVVELHVPHLDAKRHLVVVEGA
ncbi:MAG TPA: 16S rRNA (guanine(527)-N(7))-methyltransferase RsmG [Myxococcota bacterium]|nr:16S rRNA (guanine(527)-N(7))-methyltransferase RsmG [Myxococcota bacterium]